MPWAPGEKEREEAWFASRQKRFAKRAELELAMAGDPGAYAALYDRFEPLVDLKRQLDAGPEPEFEDSKVIKNHNLW